jgi:hypothetical protein
VSESNLSFRLAQLMRERRFDEAMGLARGHLAAYPDDLETLLRLGICCLLNRAEDEFLQVHGRAALLVSRVGELTERLARLWQFYQRLLAQLATPVLWVGATSLAGCDKKPPETVPTAAAEVSRAPTTSPAQPTREPATPATATTNTASAHRYSAGVYKPPSPSSAHRYSAGVFKPRPN